ncbi:elongation factor G [Ornithinimicrobium cerasi]|uniref:Translation elongation factor 2 (EF-2/EF-G) n=1 Tax=Ornithinimicrobium cerasi TaxID=2248773 RepID=A0A285VRN7_9MICO|nr:elongation factor G [Ornithinimicrobium cerasi]SOC56613.1 translation elongation factor 2 (EF-2/EF-G) [Ornithinimicrobium cerasi]
MNRTVASSFSAPGTPAAIRNVVLVGPQGTGKSALVEQLSTGQLGHVRDAEEASAAVGVVSTVHEPTGTVVTLVDTPGRPDFVGEVRAGLRAADAVLFVVAAGSGIDEATRMLWRECDAVGIPRAVAVTQLELARADWDQVVDECRRVLGEAVPVGLPLLEGQSLTGVLDLLEQVAHDASGQTRPLTEDDAARVEEARGGFVEAVIEQSEDEGLLDRYLAGEELDLDGLRADLATAVATARFFPIVPVNPPTGVGVPALLDLIVHAFPSPDRAWLPAVMTPQGGGFGELTADPEGPLVAQVIRTTTDPYVGRLSLVRIFSGTLTADAHLHVSGHLEWVVGHEVEGHPGHDEDDERPGQLSSPVPGGTTPRESAGAGEIVLVTKLSSAGTSDTLSSMDRPALVEPWLLPEPLLPVAIQAARTKDEDKLATALQRLIAEDLTLRLERNAETHQLVLWTLGPAQVDDVLVRLRDRHHVEITTEPVRTSMRETFVRPVSVQGRLVKQSGGHGQYAVVQLEVEPLERGAGFEFVDKVVGGSVPRAYIPSVEKGLRHQLAEGVLAGYPCVDVRVTLTDGKSHSVDSSDMAFQTAAALGLREAANESTVSLLEPVDLVEVVVGDDYVGAVMADLRGRRAQVQGTEPAELEGHTVVRAEVPQHELSRYPIDLRSVSHGSGTFTRSFARYDYLPASLARELTG